MIPQDRLKAMIAGEESWDTPEVVGAIQAGFVDLDKNGCFNPSVNAASYDDAIALFTSGMAAMVMTGSWMIPTLQEAPFNVDFFFLPAPEGGTTTPPAGLSSGYFVSAATAASRRGGAVSEIPLRSGQRQLLGRGDVGHSSVHR